MRSAAVSEGGVTISQHPGRARMAAAIADCQVLLARGMGAGAYRSMELAAIRPVIADVADIDRAVQAYVEGRLVDRKELLH